MNEPEELKELYMISRTIAGRLATTALLALLAIAAAACGSPPASEAPAAGSATGAAPAAPTASGAENAEGDTEHEEAESKGDPEKGKAAFLKTCIGCHGPDAKGLPNLGKNLHANVFVAGKTDAEMVAFLKVGRPADDPLNTTHVAMPPKGGNPALKDEDLIDIIAFIRSLKE